MRKRLLAVVCAALTPLGAVNAETIPFDEQAAGKTPAGFSIALTGEGQPPVWKVQKQTDGGAAVVQTSAEAIDYRYPLLVYDKVTASDINLSVTFKTVSGRNDQTAGLVWRYSDAQNYYLVRANALEDNVVLYKVQNGKRISLAPKGSFLNVFSYGASAPVPKARWNTLSVKIRGKLFSVNFNGKDLYEVEDETFVTPGKVGLWTKADSVTAFRDFDVTVAQ